MPNIIVEEPHLVANLLSKEKRKANVLLLEISGLIEQNKWSARLNLIFQTIDAHFPTFPGDKTRRTYHFACTNANLEMTVNEGKVISHTPSTRIQANLSCSEEFDDNTEVSIRPEVEVKPVTVKPGGWTSSAMQKKTVNFSIMDTESDMVATKGPNFVKWTFDTVRAQRPYRDYIEGNYLLKADVEWDGGSKQGTLSLTPEVTSIFDEQKRKVSRRRALWIQYVVYRFAHVTIENPAGLEFNYHIE